MRRGRLTAGPNFNPQPVDVPPSQALVQSGDLQDTVLLVAESLNGNHYTDAPTGWTQTLKPCDHPEAEATLTLNEPTYWSVTFKNLPGVMPFTQVSLSEPFGEWRDSENTSHIMELFVCVEFGRLRVDR